MVEPTREQRMFRFVGLSLAGACVLGAIASLAAQFAGRDRFDILALVLGYSGAALAGGLPLGRSMARWLLTGVGVALGSAGVVSRLV